DWRENGINREFAQYFPQVDKSLSRQWPAASFLIGPRAESDGLRNPPEKSVKSTTQYISYAYGPISDAETRSPPGSSPPELTADVDTLTPAALTTKSVPHPGTPRSQEASVFGNAKCTSSFRDCNSDGSAFTDDLPLEAKMLLVDSGQSDAVGPTLYDQQWIDENAALSNEVSKIVKVQDAHCAVYVDSLDSMNWGPVPQPNIYADDPSWNTFVNVNAWENDE
ncbi:hypothetical protein EDB81DRAFT_613951, partial [Dactylonectria macrodidyma]